MNEIDKIRDKANQLKYNIGCIHSNPKLMLEESFIAGYRYALNNQWINVKDDLPYNHKDLVIEDSISYTKKVLTTNITGKFFISYMIKFHNGWEWQDDSNVFLPEELKTTLWMPIPELSTDDSKAL